MKAFGSWCLEHFLSVPSPHWSSQSIKAQQPCYMNHALIIELLLTAFYLIVETDKSFMDCTFWHKLCCWGRMNGCLIAARLVVSAAGAILDREKTSDAFAFLFCPGVHRRCGWPQDRRQDREKEELGRYFYPIPWVGLWVERAMGNHGASELAKVIDIIFDATLEECENLFYA